jgi:putative heme-binding domain-containing protein
MWPSLAVAAKIKCGGLILPAEFDQRMHPKHSSFSSTGSWIPVSAGTFGCVLLFFQLMYSQARNPQRQETEPRQQVQAFREGPRTFETICAGCHGLDGKGSERGPDIVSRPETLRLSDAETLQILEKGEPAAGMPAFGLLGSGKLKAVLSHLRTLQGKGTAVAVTGNPQRGKSIFFGKARCSECHMIDGAGGFLGPDLTQYALSRSPAEIRGAITNPGGDAAPQKGLAYVTTRDGKKYEGVTRNEDNFSMQLQSLDGTFHLLAKSEIERVELSRQPLMPADYNSALNTHELDDLVSYLVAAAKSSTSPKPVKAKRQDHEDD